MLFKNIKKAKTPLQSFAVLWLLAVGSGCSQQQPEVQIKLGDLVRERGQELHYVQGNVIDCKNLSIHHLVGNISGEATKRVFVQTMQGNVENGAVTVDVLHGNIIVGKQVTVNLLIGTDYSGQAAVARRLDPASLSSRDQ